MKVKLKRAYVGYVKGSELNVSPKRAQYWVDNDIATCAGLKKTAPKKKAPAKKAPAKKGPVAKLREKATGKAAKARAKR